MSCPVFLDHNKNKCCVVLEEGWNIICKTVCTHVQKMRTALICAVTQRVVVISCRRFGSTCRSHRRGQESKISTQNMGPIGCPETWVRNYHYTLRNDPEEHISHLLRSGSLLGCYVVLIGKVIKISTECRAFIFSVKHKKKCEVNVILEMLASAVESTSNFRNVDNSLDSFYIWASKKWKAYS